MTEKKDSRASLEETDYFDLELVEFHDEELRDIAAILKLSDTTKDKLMFTIFMLNICVTAFIVGYLPQYFYLWHTQKAIVLLSYRWYAYKKLRWHYFLFDFCYFTNFFILIYLWLPLGDSIRGLLFPIIFGFSNGPVLSAIVLWTNSVVPHSIDKMTSLFIHLSPSLALWGIRWFTSEEQGFPLCYSPTHSGPDGCQHVDMMEIVLYPMLLYIVWQLLYIVWQLLYVVWQLLYIVWQLLYIVWQLLYIGVVEVWRKERVEERQYATSYKWIVERAQKGFFFRMFSIFGLKHRKTMFMVWQFIYTTLSIFLAYLCYHYKHFNVVLVLVVTTAACYNGASFYIDVFSQRYHFERVLKSGLSSNTKND